MLLCFFVVVVVVHACACVEILWIFARFEADRGHTDSRAAAIKMKEERKLKRPAARLLAILLMSLIGHVSNECVDQAVTCAQFASSCNLESASINGKFEALFGVAKGF